MQRFAHDQLAKDLDRKLVFVSGPRQAGKTTLAKQLYPEHAVYLNFDSDADRKLIRQRAWSREAPLVIFDELHKMKGWKRWLKGLYDTEPRPPRLLVTGSARLDTFRRGSDSLAGRFLGHRLHPLSVAEVVRMRGDNADAAFERMLRLGGFPEPYLALDERETLRWRRSHLDTILRQDLLDLEPVRDLRSIELLVDLLAERVGGLVSYASLAEDLQVSPHTVKKWIGLLEALFVVFVVTPHSRRVERSLLKQPKIYFFDVGRVVDEPAARFENLVACALYKHSHFREDSLGERRALHFLRDKEKREVDFVTLRDGKPEWLVEAKLTDIEPAPALRYFSARLQPAAAIQLVAKATRRADHAGVTVEPAARWLAQLEQ